MDNRLNSDALLHDIAKALGCPVAAFSSASALASEAGTAAELFRLWDMLTEPQARQRVLACARQEAARQQAKVQAAE